MSAREADTRDPLRRAHIVANWSPIYIGKESGKHCEEGEDLSVLEFQTIEYKRKGYTIATSEQMERIGRIPKREFMRSQPTRAGKDLLESTHARNQVGAVLEGA